MGAGKGRTGWFARGGMHGEIRLRRGLPERRSVDGRGFRGAGASV